MHRGYVKAYRKLFASQEWLDMKKLPGGFPRPCSWLDLIGLANHKEGYVRPRNDGLRVKIVRGQCGWSIKSIAERWGWSATKVNCFLLELSEDEQIVTQKNNQTTIITIINYNLYQGEVSQNNAQKIRKSGAEVSQSNTNNNKEALEEGKETATAARVGEDWPYIKMPELALLLKVPGYPFDLKMDFKKLGELCLEFPMVDVTSLLKNWTEYIGDNPFKKKSSPRSQLRNQFVMAKNSGRFKKEDGNGSGPRRPDAGDRIKEAEEAFEEQEGQP